MNPEYYTITMYGSKTNEVYLRMINLCRCLEATILHPDTKPMEKAACTNAVLEVEYFKREMRGVPRLKAHALRDMPLKNTRRSITDAVETPATTSPVESEGKESLSRDDRDRTTTPDEPRTT